MSRFKWLEVVKQPLEPVTGEVAADLYDKYLTDADSAFLRGEAERALKLYGRAMAVTRTEARPWCGQILALIELEQAGEAVVWADRALEALPEHGDLFAAKALAYAAQGNIDKARGFVDAAFEKSPSAFAWYARGAVFAPGNPKVADSCFTKAMEIDASGQYALRGGRLFCRQGEFARALPLLKQAREKMPKNAQVWDTLAAVYRALGDQELATAAEYQAQSLAPLRDKRTPGNANAPVGLWRKILRALGVGS